MSCLFATLIGFLGSWVLVCCCVHFHSYVWSIPANFAPTGTYRIRMEDTRSSSVNDNGGSFEIFSAPSLTVTAPTNGNVWTKGNSQYTLEWTSTGSVSAVDVLLLRGGQADVTVATNEGNDGVYTITSSMLQGWATGAGYTLVVRASSASSAFSGVTATSGSFQVVEASTVSVNDVGSAGCTTGVACSIVFTASGSVSAVKIQYQQGATVGLVVASTATSPYAWTPTASVVAPGEYVLRVEAVGNSVLHAISSTFTVHPAPLMTLVLPGSASTWVQGTPTAVVWTSVGAVGATLSFTLHKNGAAEVVLASGETNDGILTLSGGTVASIPAGSGYSLVVSDGNGHSDTSSGTFDVRGADGVVVTSPIGGTICIVGTPCSVGWTTTGTVTTVDLSYIGGSGGGGGVLKHNAVSSPWTWTVPATLAAGEYIIRANAGNGVVDTGSAFFVTEAQATTITSPSSNDVWVVGKSATIAWSVTNANALSPTDIGVTLEILDQTGTDVLHTISNGATPAKTIGATTSLAEYTFDYDAVSAHVLSPNPAVEKWCRVRMTKGTYVAVSPTFVLRPAPTLSVSRPTSGATIANGATTSIQYAKVGAVGAVTIDLLRSNGLVLVS